MGDNVKRRIMELVLGKCINCVYCYLEEDSYNGYCNLRKVNMGENSSDVNDILERRNCEYYFKNKEEENNE